MWLNLLREKKLFYDVWLCSCDKFRRSKIKFHKICFLNFKKPVKIMIGNNLKQINEEKIKDKLTFCAGLHFSKMC